MFYSMERYYLAPVSKPWPFTLGAFLVVLGLAGPLVRIADRRSRLESPAAGKDVQVSVGNQVVLPAELSVRLASPGAQTVVLHFLSGSCPASKEAVAEVRRLSWQYGGKVRFLAVLPETETQEPSWLFMETQGIETIRDTTGEISRAVGVFTAPHAVILSPSRKLVFRGNYNLSRYAQDADTAFVGRAIELAVAGREDEAAFLSARAGGRFSFGCTSVRSSPLGLLTAGKTTAKD